MKIEFDSSRKILLIDYIDSGDITPGDQDDINAFIDFAKSVLRRRVGTKPPVVKQYRNNLYGGHEGDAMIIKNHLLEKNSTGFVCKNCGLVFHHDRPNTWCYPPPADKGSDVTSEAVHAVSKDSPVASNAPIQAEAAALAAALEYLGKSGVIHPEHDWEGQVLGSETRYYCIRCGKDAIYGVSDPAVVQLPSGPCVA